MYVELVNVSPDNVPGGRQKFHQLKGVARFIGNGLYDDEGNGCAAPLARFVRGKWFYEEGSAWVFDEDGYEDLLIHEGQVPAQHG